MTISNLKLSNRIKPDVAAPWVIEEIEKLEKQLDIKDAEIDDLGDDLAQVKRKLTATQADFDVLKEENESLLKNLRGKHSVTGATYAHLIAERNQLRQQLEELKTTETKTLELIKGLQHQIALLRQKLTDYVLCKARPMGYFQPIISAGNQDLIGYKYSKDPIEGYEPLYRAKEN